jgi:chorismate lyase/3-hydroxybenzoate synthase
MTAPADQARTEQALSLDPPAPPGWVERLVFAHPVESEAWVRDGTMLRTSESGALVLLRAAVPGAKVLPDREFRVCVERTYLAIGELLRERSRIPLRFWNYVPGIRARMSGGLSRYELFNLGRYLAYTAWYGSAGFGGRLSAASAVDHRGDDLVVHVLAGSHPGTALENPRQTPAYRYSRRFGPLPPCFSRATRVPGSPGAGTPWAIVAGTSSIVGEDTRHAGDCEAQLEETLLNLAHLSAAFAGDLPGAGAGLAADARTRALARLRHLRVYLVREVDAAEVVARLRRDCSELDELEVFAADLCRPELLVEVEGVLRAPGMRERSLGSGSRGGSRRRR